MSTVTPEALEPASESVAPTPKRVTLRRRLTDLQRRGLDLLWAGHSVTEVARQLGVNRGTVWSWYAKNANFIAEWDRRIRLLEHKAKRVREQSEAEIHALKTIREMAKGPQPGGAKPSLATLKAACLVLGADFHQRPRLGKGEPVEARFTEEELAEFDKATEEGQEWEE